MMGGRVTIRAVGPGRFLVSTIPEVGAITRAFSKADGWNPFEQAVQYASNCAAGLCFIFVDETGQFAPEACARLVAEAKNGAQIVAIH